MDCKEEMEKLRGLLDEAEELTDMKEYLAELDVEYERAYIQAVRQTHTSQSIEWRVACLAERWLKYLILLRDRTTMMQMVEAKVGNILQLTGDKN